MGRVSWGSGTAKDVAFEDISVIFLWGAEALLIISVYLCEGWPFFSVTFTTMWFKLFFHLNYILKVFRKLSLKLSFKWEEILQDLLCIIHTFFPYLSLCGGTGRRYLKFGKYVKLEMRITRLQYYFLITNITVLSLIPVDTMAFFNFTNGGSNTIVSQSLTTYSIVYSSI